MFIERTLWLGDDDHRFIFRRAGLSIGMHMLEEARELDGRESGTCALFVDADDVRATVQDLLERGVWHPVVAVMAKPTVVRAIEALRSGALDVYAPSKDPADLQAVLERLEDVVPEMAVENARIARAARKIRELSPRERDVLRAMIDLGTNKEIGRALGISSRTVEIHRANMLRKMGAASTAAAVAQAIAADRFNEWLSNASGLPMSARNPADQSPALSSAP